MNKKIKSELNEKMQVKLPENLEKENIINMLETPEKAVKEYKSNRMKKLIPLAASLALVIGLLSAFGNSVFNKDINTGVDGDAGVVQYQSYDKIYKKFDVLHKDAKNSSIKNGFFNMFGNKTAETIDDEVSLDGVLTGGGAVSENMNGMSEINGAAPGNTSDFESNINHGTTNTQEQGVDEGDIVKTDGKYLYIAEKNASTVTIVDIQNKQLEKISKIEFDHEEKVQEIYLNGDKIIIVGTVFDETQTGSASSKLYAYDMAFEIGNSFVKVYDITNKTEPEIVTEYSQQGQYKNSRMIGTKLYCISTYFVNVARDDYKDYCIPETTINGVCEPIPAGCISVIEDSDSTSYAVVTTLDISTSTEPDSEAVLGNCENLYASSQSMFLTEIEWDENSGEYTKIYRFEYTDKGVDYKCMGKVPGHIKNQFSMSHDGEYFRISTTQNNVTSDGNYVAMSIDDRTNNLYILNNDMQVVGKVENLAKGETIQSVRYIGNTAYVVTFRQTDPLFVIDLSDPTKPTVKGELKITGFSEYLHPISSSLLVGVGQDGTESGTNGDCKVSLFDVSNPDNPFEASKATVTNGSANVYSPVAYNHKCFVNLPNNEFTVPFMIYSHFIASHSEPQNMAYYIRYKVENGAVKELARYPLAEDCEMHGGTYAGDIFFAIITDYKNNSYNLIAFDLNANQEINRVSL